LASKLGVISLTRDPVLNPLSQRGMIQPGPIAQYSDRWRHMCELVNHLLAASKVNCEDARRDALARAPSHITPIALNH
jgi:hypothetical protein